MVASPPREKAKVAPKSKTQEYRRWRGVNLTDSRTDIEDDELAWMENAVTVGKGAIQITPTVAASIASIAAGVAKFRGENLTIAGVSTAVFITVNNDGSATQVNATTGAQTVICAAGVLTSSAVSTIFRDTTILFVDPTKGYASWTGAGVFAIIDATKTGTTLAVFESRVWIGNGKRTITFTAPNTFNDFAGADGAGSTIVTDEAFPGVIVDLISVVEQLWIAGNAAFETVSNVSTVGGVTTFSITNILTGLGTNAPSSVIGYFRSLCFFSSSGIWALAGVTPQKLSDKLDGMIPGLTLVSNDAPSAIADLYGLKVLCTLVTYTQASVPNLPTPASGSSAATKLLLCFTQGKWFFASQGSLTWITTLNNNGVSEVWGTDGTTIFKIFGGGAATVNYKVQTKLYSFGASTSAWQVKRSGFEFQANASIAPMLTIDNGATSETEAVSAGNVVTWLNSGGSVVTWLNSLAQTVTWIAQGFVLSRTVANMYGNYLGMAITGTDAPYRIAALQMEIAPSGDWLLAAPNN